MRVIQDRVKLSAAVARLRTRVGWGEADRLRGKYIVRGGIKWLLLHLIGETNKKKRIF